MTIPPRMRMPITSVTMTDAAALYRLMTWLSPAYPIGGFSYSHGLEYAVEAKLVHDAATLRDWVETVVTLGTGRSDGALFVAAYKAVAEEDWEGLNEITELAAAWRGTREMALESAMQGPAFLATTRTAWPHPDLEMFVRKHKDASLPVAVAVACAAHGIALTLGVSAYLHSFAANLVSAGLRLIPLGQTDGQRVIAALEPAIAAAGKEAETTPLDRIGTAAPLIDWCSMQHETQYTRLFRS